MAKRQIYAIEYNSMPFDIKGVGRLVSRDEFMRHAGPKEKELALRANNFYYDTITGGYRALEPSSAHGIMYLTELRRLLKNTEQELSLMKADLQLVRKSLKQRKPKIIAGVQYYN